MAEPSVRATRYEVTCLPPDHRSARHFTITVEWRGHGLWAVADGSACLSRTGEWDYEPMSSNRTDEWIADHRFDLDTALALAMEAAPRLVVNGWTVDKVLADIAAREAS